MKVHNKLVRDKIPRIIEEAGKTCVTHVLSNILPFVNSILLL